MERDVVIRAEGLGKRYLIGHRAERDSYRSLRDDLVRSTHRALRTAADMARGRQILAGDEIEEFWALKNVDFEIRRGDVVGVIGRNGAGKSTLLKVLSRITEPSEGRVSIRGRVASLLEVGTGFHGELSGRENIYLNGAILGMTRAEVRRRFDEIVDFAGVERFLDTPVKRYSSGMYVRLAFSVAAHLEPEILIVDEVLAVGDAEFQQKCLGKMDAISSEGRTVLFVSHNTANIRKLCNRGFCFRSGALVFEGSVQASVDFYAHDGVVTPDGHVLRFEAGPADRFHVRSLETLDPGDRPKPSIATWDPVRFRIRFWAPHGMRRFSVAVRFMSPERVEIMRCDAWPESGFEIPCNAGENTVDLDIDRMPLAEGEYLLSVGLVEPRVRWLASTPPSFLTITAADVFKSGTPPNSRNGFIATPHAWRLPETVQAGRN